MTITYANEDTTIEYLASSEEQYPNVVRLEIPFDHREDGAAWIYVPSKGPNGTIYIGPPGSYQSGGSVELAATIKRLVDVKKDEKLLSGVMYNDGYIDYFTGADEELADNISGALYDYHDAYYSGNGAFSGTSRGHENEFSNYPTEDDTAYDPEDDNDGESDPIYDNDTGKLIGYLPKEDRGKGNIPDLEGLEDDSKWSWLKDRDWSADGDYRTMKPTHGHNMGPIENWSPEDHHAWKDRANAERHQYGGGGGGWGSAREGLAHFRWSFGDAGLIPGAPHDGLWLWPTENGYPDHFAQTGHKGLGRCAQGRVYPTIDGRWEILTWPGRPRDVKDPHVVATIKAEAQKAVEQYLIDKVGVDPKDIFYTEMSYGDAVSNYDSPSYPGYNWKAPRKNKGQSFEWDADRGMYDHYYQTAEKSDYIGPKTPLFDENGDATYRSDGQLPTKVRNFIPDSYLTRITIPAGHWDVVRKGWVPSAEGYFDRKTETWIPDESVKDIRGNPVKNNDPNNIGAGKPYLDYIPDPDPSGENLPAGHYDSTRKGWIPNEPGYWDVKHKAWVPSDEDDRSFETGDRPGILKKVVDKIKGRQDLSPEDKWQEAIDQHDAYQKAKQEKIDAALREHAPHLLPENQKSNWSELPNATGELEAPEGTSKLHAGDTKYTIHKNNGSITVVSDQDYERAVEELGQDNWWKKFLDVTDPKDQATSISKGATNIHDEDPDTVEGFINALRRAEQPTGQKWEQGGMKRDAFVWLGFGYGDDMGIGDPKEAEVITAVAHWQLVNRIMPKSMNSISEFMDASKTDRLTIPMVWGYVTTHPGMKGLYVTFLSHLMGGFRQDLEYIPMALGALSTKYNKPIEEYDTDESETPILERFPVSGGGVPPEPLATAPTPQGAGQQRVDLGDHKVLAQGTVGLDVTVTTYSTGTGDNYETSVEGGELDGHLFPSYSREEALRMHETILRDEENTQRSSAIIGESKKGTALADFDLNPAWSFFFGQSSTNPQEVYITYSEGQLTNALKTAGVKSVFKGRVGKVFGQTWVYETESNPISDKAASQIEKALTKKFGADFLPYAKLAESVKSGEIPSFLLPTHACFGYINGNLIIGQRHHQEVMYRLLENGWSWDDLMNAKQVWGWFSKQGAGEDWNMWFSSDAGIMSSEDLKAECMAKFSKMFNVKVSNSGGYGGKTKKTYGGNFGSKYGDPKAQKPEEMQGNKAKYDSTILSPLPPPPEKTVVEAVAKAKTVAEDALKLMFPGGGKAPPKKIAVSKRKKHKGVKYHGLHDPIVLRHVWHTHDWFENNVPHVEDEDHEDHDEDDNHDASGAPSEDVGTESVVAA